MGSYSISEIYARHPDLADFLDVLRSRGFNISGLYTKGNNSGKPYIYFNKPGHDETRHVRISKREADYSVIYKFGTGIGVQTIREMWPFSYDLLSEVVNSTELREYLNF